MQDALLAFFRNAPEPAFAIRTDGTILSASTSAARLLGLADPANLIDRRLDSYLDKDDRRRFLQSLRRCSAETASAETTPDADLPEPLRLTSRIVRRGRDPRHVEISIGSSSDGTILTVNFRDITKRKQLEVEVLHAAAEERRRIAADLHDGLCQELSALHFGTASLRSLTASTSSEQARQLADAVVSMAAAAVEHARTISHGLSPMLGNPGNLEEAIRRLADTSSDIQLLPCKVRGSFGEDPIQEEIATQLYHIAVEAVHNARKHSNATSVVIDLQRQKDHLSLRVRDNGIGLPPSALHSNTGRGLRFMQYRADQAGATLHISPGRSGGSVVVCEVNLPAPQSPPKTSPHHGLTPTPPTD